MPLQYHFLIKRRFKVPEIQISKQAILAYFALFLTGIFFAFYARLFGFRARNWYVLNIMTAQMGGALQQEHGILVRTSEKIFLITMYVVTFMVSDLATDYFLQIFNYRLDISDFTTLGELANSAIALTMMEEHLLHLALIGDHIDVKKIVKHTEGHASVNGYGPFCSIDVVYGKVDESIDACIVGSRDLITVSKMSDGWYVDTIDEPIETVYPYITIRYSETLGDTFWLLKHRFSHLVDRFMENGFVNYWNEKDTRDTVSHILKRGGDPTIIENGRDKYENYNKGEALPLKYQLAAVMVAGATVSVIVLVCEILWVSFLKKTKIGTFIGAFNHYQSKKFTGYTVSKPVGNSKLVSIRYIDPASL
ncbi:hypothetical protein QAD02_016757 [Eretmocerus hayati]|uniref:Uncharacterized protein n=1 Tax=Eretmocerus hayati TaxID=131215 RepID=A0ACC2PGT3_9HYME|nr:hypothetical protein QAD02_016757 [Eretmocerus hayati]